MNDPGDQLRFAELETPVNPTPLADEILLEWVAPFELAQAKAGDIEFVRACRNVTGELVLSLLGEPDWRSRLMGARFAAIREFVEFQTILSNLLLKSELRSVGAEYCISLATFGNEAAADALCTYLDFYLQRPDLWLDQGMAMGALMYLDALHGQNRAARFSEAWQKFAPDEPAWVLEDLSSRVRAAVEVNLDLRREI